MNPDTNKFEELVDGSALRDALEKRVGVRLYRSNGEPVPDHWSTFQQGENVVVKDYTFKVVHIGESYLVLEPVGVPIIGGKEDEQG